MATKQRNKPKPEKDEFVWQRESVVDRLKKCRAMLHMHGMMTDSESQRVAGRIRRLEHKPRACKG